jgi:hypothetical protein
MEEISKEAKEDREEQLRLMRENNLLIRRQIKDNNNWTLILLRGMVMGLGAAVGATVILSLAVWMIRPLQGIEPIKPAVERLVETLEKLERHRPGGGVIDEEAAKARGSSTEPIERVRGEPDSPKGSSQ